MALTPSEMVDLGTRAPDFNLPDTNSGEDVTLADARGERGTLVMFICNHCPFVKHLKDELLALDDYSDEIGIVAISSNDVSSHPQDSPELMAQEGYPFPYLYDETQEVAIAFEAQCTPDFFLYNHQDELVYRGQFDDSRPGNDEPVTGEDLRTAIENLIDGKEISSDQKPSVGCNIKWK